MKLYLRELPDPLMTMALYDEWMSAAHAYVKKLHCYISGHKVGKVRAVKSTTDLNDTECSHWDKIYSLYFILLDFLINN